jgi:hypothetical protein
MLEADLAVAMEFAYLRIIQLTNLELRIRQADKPVVSAQASVNFPDTRPRALSPLP